MTDINANGQYRKPEHKFAGYFCECTAPLYKRGDEVFCKRCGDPRPVRVMKPVTVEDMQVAEVEKVFAESPKK